MYIYICLCVCVWCVWCVCVCVCVCDSGNPHIFLQVQSIESMQNDVNLESKLWEREKYWQCQLFTNTHGMNSGLTSIQVKEKIAGKTDKVSFVNLCNLMHCLHKCF